MTNSERILNIAKENGGYVTTKEIRNKKINTGYLSKLVSEQKLERISTGYYIFPNTFVDEYFKVLSKSKNAIFSYATTLYLHNLSDRTPIYFDITVPRGYGGPLQKIDNVYLHYVGKNNINLGMKEIKSPLGMNIKCYDMERTICDIIKDKNNMDKEIYTKALREYSKRSDKDLLKLIKYAKKLNVEKQVVEVMELIL